jgi:hypothetical protein
MIKLFYLGQISVILPYFGYEYENYYLMLYLNKYTHDLVKQMPRILGDKFMRLPQCIKLLFYDYASRHIH